jgi:hypothetical protein
VASSGRLVGLLQTHACEPVHEVVISLQQDLDIIPGDAHQPAGGVPLLED